MEDKSVTVAAHNNSFFISRKLSNIALLLWFLSILLPGLIFYGQSDLSWGISILLFGWIGILGTYVAWYANIFLLVAITRLRREKSSEATIPAVVAFILALDTFRVDCVTMGGPCQTVYGIGIGAIVWMIAIFLTMLAAAVQKIEASQNVQAHLQQHESFNKKFIALFLLAKTSGHEFYLGLSMALLIGFIGISASLSVHDWIVGNADERDMLKRTLGGFKRSEICSLSPKPTNQILINGPLELLMPHSYTKVISQETLLAMGVPVVRVIYEKGILPKGSDAIAEDYYLLDKKDIKSIRIRKAIGEAIARLEIQEMPTTSGAGDDSAKMAPQYHITLISKEGKIGFDQIWMEQYMHLYCPNLYEYGGKHYSLKKLIQETLVFPN